MKTRVSLIAREPLRSRMAFTFTDVSGQLICLVIALVLSTCFYSGHVAATGDDLSIDSSRNTFDHQKDTLEYDDQSPERGDVVLDWVEQAFQTVRIQKVGTPAAGRLYAMTFAAMFDAANGISRRRHRGYDHALVSPYGAPRRANKRAAAAVAAHTVLTGLPDLSSDVRNTLDMALEESLAGLRGRRRVEAGIAWGKYVGTQVLLLRSEDGSQMADVVVPDSADPGVFRMSFDRRYANMKPFAIRSAIRYQLDSPPPALSSAEYADSLNRVFSEGSIDDTDRERHDIALQWETPSGTIRPTGSAIQAAVALVRAKGTNRRLVPTARLFALLGMSVADTMIPVWHGKAEFFSWRPKPAIRRANEDGNQATLANPNFETRFGSTGGSPEYPSGQAAFSSAVAKVLEIFYRHRRLSWCFSSDSNTDGRCYDSARQMGKEAGESRIYQGVHFPFTVEASQRIGVGVGKEVARTALRRIRP